MSGPEPWPPGVRSIGVADLRRLGIDADNRLYWDGRGIEIRRPLVLTGFQKILTGIVSVFAVLGGFGGFMTGLNNASVFLCARGVHVLTCPVAPERITPPEARPPER